LIPFRETLVQQALEIARDIQVARETPTQLGLDDDAFQIAHIDINNIDE
jgi:hypothetical protein